MHGGIRFRRECDGLWERQILRKRCDDLLRRLHPAFERGDFGERGLQRVGIRLFVGAGGGDELLLRGEDGLELGAVGARLAPGDDEKGDCGGCGDGERDVAEGHGNWKLEVGG